MAKQLKNQKSTLATRNGERGSAIVISLFVLALITVFVALAMSRTSAEAAAVGNETAEARTFYGAQGSLEMMTRNFNKVFETKLNPTTTDLNNIRNAPVPGITGFTFTQELDQTSTRQNVVLTGGPYSGLFAIRDNWRLRTTATDNVGVEVQLTRNILNSRVPIFQFGIFYDDDLELFRPPRFSFGGRVHSNRHFFLSPGGAGIYFNSKVTTAGQIVTESWRNWYQGDSGNNQTFIKNASGVDQQLLPTMGSVLNTSEGAGNNMFATTPDLPPSQDNPGFETQAAIFDGNLQNETKTLRLPLKVGYPTDLVEIVKRGKKAGGDLHANAAGTLEAVTAATEDDYIMRTERYANKPGIRVSLADSKAKLPGCASGTGVAATTGVCGVRLDGDSAGFGANPSPTALPTPERVRGYRPVPMKNVTTDTTFNYRATRLNGERFYTGALVTGRELWIKVELVSFDEATQLVTARDITADFLSLGVTEQATEIRDSSNNSEFDMQLPYDDTAPSSSLTATTAQTASIGTDSRAVIKLQRFALRGPALLAAGSSFSSWYDVPGGTPFNVVERFSGGTQALVDLWCASCSPVDADAGLETAETYNERFAHLKRVSLNNTADRVIVPFPIKMFDTREGTYYDERSTTYYTDLSRLTRNGVMSMIDIDVANLRRFFRGDFNGLFPTTTTFATSNGGVGLRNSDVPQREGWIFYVSDRRGDADFDGEFDMEDIYSPAPGNTGTLQTGEDVNNVDGLLDAAYGTETERYNTNTIAPDLAAVQDHKYYRRGVRLVNGTTIPGIYDSATPSNTRGFSFASENGIYVQGNYNATGVATVPATGNTPFSDYQPYNTAVHIPASIVGDAVTILSNGWNDGQSFSSPYDEGNRIGTTTTIRFAMIAGDTISARETTPNQGGISPKLNGGVHNFKRFLERWTGNRLDYTGSLINLYNSHNNNGSFKCCNTVYDPPIRNWVFDSTFLDPTRMPPGTPFFQYVQTTGFQRTND